MHILMILQLKFYLSSHSANSNRRAGIEELKEENESIEKNLRKMRSQIDNVIITFDCLDE